MDLFLAVTTVLPVNFYFFAEHSDIEVLMVFRLVFDVEIFYHVVCAWLRISEYVTLDRTPMQRLLLKTTPEKF